MVAASVVDRRLGPAAGRLYAEVGELVDLAAGAGASESRLALSGIALRVLCGEFHDLRAGAPNPKGDLVEALRSVPGHRSIDAEIAALATRVVRGEFAESEDESARWVARVSPQRPAPGAVPPPADVEPIELTHGQWRVFVWLYRFVEVYGRSPMLKEIASGLDMQMIKVSDVLRRLAVKGAVANIGGIRGWVPLRSP